MKPPVPPLLFDWHAHDRSLLRMAMAVFVTLGGIIGLFIIFRIVTPESRPVDVRPQRVMLLNPEVPAERALIHMAMDRSFGLLPSEPAAMGPVNGIHMPVFEPSYQGFELGLKPLPSTASSSRQMRPLTLEANILPPLPESAPTRRFAAPAQVLRAVLRGEAASRAPEDLTLPQVPLADVNRLRFQVAVDAAGGVQMALPLSAGEDTAIAQKLHHALMRLRFKPSDKEVEWAQISFQWQDKEGGDR